MLWGMSWVLYKIPTGTTGVPFFPGDHHQKANLPLDKSDPLDKKNVQTRSYRVLKRGCPRGEGNWGTLRIPREDWGTLGKIRGITTPRPLKNPIKIRLFVCNFSMVQVTCSLPGLSLI